MRRVSFITLGCKVNQYDTQSMQKAFTDRGFIVVGEDEPADAVIVNTCTVTGEADRKSRQMIRRAVRRNPSALIVAAGCFVQGDPLAARSIEGVAITAGANDRLGLVNAVADALDMPSAGDVSLVEDISGFGGYEEIGAEGTDGMSRAYLKIEDGCDAYCSYCYVPYVRGHVRSRSIESISEEAGRLAAAGYAEVILTGIHLGCYGKDFGGRPNLADAVRAVCKADGIRRVRISSLEPTELTEELLKLFEEEPKLARHLHLPLQSGDDSILRAMNRHYDSSYFRGAVEGARRRLGDIGITTDVIAGFPGETEQMFENTLAMVSWLGFMHVHAFPYSVRRGTPAAGMPGQVPENVKADRVRRIIEEASHSKERILGAMEGRVFEVVLESKVIEDGGVVAYEGYTSEYARVRFTSGGEPSGMVSVLIEGRSGEYATGRAVTTR